MIHGICFVFKTSGTLPSLLWDTTLLWDAKTNIFVKYMQKCSGGHLSGCNRLSRVE